MLIFRPRASRIAPRDAEAMPFPSEETTPPVTKTNLDMWAPPIKRLARASRLKHNQTKPKGTMKIRREFRLPDRGHSDNPLHDTHYTTTGASRHATASPGASAAALKR